MLLAVLLAAVLLLAGCTGAGAPSGQSAADTGFVGGVGVVSIPPNHRTTAPDLTGPKVGGGQLTLSAYRGRIVVLNVWGSWCAPCRSETPALVRSAKELGKQGVAFVGLNTKDNDAAAEAFIQDFKVPYPSFYDPDGSLLLSLRASVSPKGIPSTLVIDPQGQVAAVIVGGVTQQALSSIVGTVLLEDVRGTGAATPSSSVSSTSASSASAASTPRSASATRAAGTSTATAHAGS